MKHYTNGLFVIEVIRSTDKTVFYRASDCLNEPESRMLKTTFERDFHEVDDAGPGEEDGPWAEGWEFRAGTAPKTEPDNKRSPMGLMALTKIATLNVKREKQFRKDLRYGSRKAKVVAKRALLHAKV